MYRIKLFFKRILITSTLILFCSVLAFSEEIKSDKALNQLVDTLKKSVVFIGTLEGNVNNTLFLKIKDISEVDSKEIFKELVKKGYVDEQGSITHKFKPLEEPVTIEIDEKFNKFKADIIGVLKERLNPAYQGTGFLVRVDNIFYLVTAKHVFVDRRGNLKDQDLVVFFNSKNGMIKFRPINAVKKKHNVDWVFDLDAKVDIALIPFGLDVQNDDVRVISDSLFYSSEKIMELYEVFFLSYQPGIVTEKRISPIIRSGMVSIINEDKTFYVDGFAFPGNSGSPVFIKFAPLAISEDGAPYFINIKKNLGIKFLGIVGECLTSQEVAISIQTGRPRMVFEENTGLSKIWSVGYLNQIINSDAFKKQHNKIKDKVTQEQLKKEEGGKTNP